MIDNLSIKDVMVPAIVVRNTSTLQSVVEKMCNEKTNAILVINENEVLVGEVNVVQVLQAIVPDYTETDSIAAHFVSEDIFKEEIEKAKSMPVSEFMITDRKTVKESASLMEVAVIAIERGQARIPVVDADDKLVGVITRRGLKKIIAKNLDLINCFQD